MAAPELVARAAVPSRVALAGNPSDGYSGAVLAVTLDAFCARVEARTAPVSSVRPANELVSAAVARFAREIQPRARVASISWRTSIPRSVGLGGSSALVLATLRALCALHWITLSREELAAIALAVETEDLGIAAGLQDRVAQAYGGLTFMDFSTAAPGGHGSYEQLPASALPPLVVAWRADAGEDSGVVHGRLRARFEQSDPAVLAAISALSAAARSARDSLLAGDPAEFARCVDASFDARAAMLPLDRRHVQMVTTARACGASANYAGSGGAIVCVCRDEEQQSEVIEHVRASGCDAIAPSFGAAAPRPARAGFHV